MTIVGNLITMKLMLGVFALALFFATSDDWRDNLLAYIVIIVYVFIAINRVIRLTRKNRS